MPAWLIPALIGGGSALLGSRSADRAADAQAGSSREAIAFQRESRDLVRADTAHLRDASVLATDALLSMVGLPSAGSYGYGASSGPTMTPEVSDRVNRRDYLGSRGGDRSSRDTNVDYGYGGDRAFNPPWRKIRGMAQGGYLPEGEVAMVGEYGPEIGVPQGGSYDPTPVVLGAQGPEVVQADEGMTVVPNPNTPPPTSGVEENPGGQPDRYNFMTDPGYGFRFDEGLRALNTHMAAGGRSVGTAMDRSTIRYGQDYASGEYGRVFDRLNAIRTGSQTGISTGANATTQAGYGMGQAAQSAGNARASSYLGQYAAWANAGNQFAQMGGQYGWF